jgi:hypothetical protein
MKGTMSELELSRVRPRSFEALHQRARRGELLFIVTVGYRNARRDRVEMEPDLRVREAMIADNSNSAELMARRSVRRGDPLLAGLLRCGHCGRWLHVSHRGTVGFCARYHCRGANINHGTERCISFGGPQVDAAVSAEPLRVLAPLGIEATLRALDARAADSFEVHRQKRALTQARYEARLARRSMSQLIPTTG